MEAIIKRIGTWLAAHPVIRKPLNTFWQAFVSVFVLGLGDLLNVLTNQGVDAAKAAVAALIVASGAAALSAVKTYVVESLKES